MRSKFLALIYLFISLNIQVAVGQIGDPAPNFTVTDTKGNSHTLYDYLDNGKKVLLDFFFTTCIPCQYYSPQVNLAYMKYGCNEGDVVFMSIDLNNSNAEVTAYEEEYKIEFPSISGDEGGGNAVINQYNVNSFPRFYLIDSTHKIIDVIDPPTLQVFDFRFGMHDINEMSCNVALTEINNTQHFIIYPNPTKEEVNIKFNNSNLTNKEFTFKILDLTGNLLLKGQLFDENISIEKLTKGVYILELSTNNKKYYSKLCVQ